MMMKIITFFMFTSIIMSKPLYGDKQLYSMLKNHCKMITGFPNLLDMHIYSDKEGSVLQLDIEGVDINNKDYVLMVMEAMSLIGQYSKIPFHKFILIEHYPEPKIPTGFESDADCAINYFVNQKILENTWIKDCLSNSILQRKIENWSQLNKNN